MGWGGWTGWERGVWVGVGWAGYAIYPLDLTVG